MYYFTNQKKKEREKEGERERERERFGYWAFRSFLSYGNKRKDSCVLALLLKKGEWRDRKYA